MSVSTIADEENATDLGAEFDEAVRDALIESFVEDGYTDEEATCLGTAFAGDLDDADILAMYEDCGITLSRMAEITGG